MVSYHSGYISGSAQSWTDTLEFVRQAGIDLPETIVNAGKPSHHCSRAGKLVLVNHGREVRLWCKQWTCDVCGPLRAVMTSRRIFESVAPRYMALIGHSRLLAYKRRCQRQETRAFCCPRELGNIFLTRDLVAMPGITAVDLPLADGNSVSIEILLALCIPIEGKRISYIGIWKRMPDGTRIREDGEEEPDELKGIPLKPDDKLWLPPSFSFEEFTRRLNEAYGGFMACIHEGRFTFNPPQNLEQQDIFYRIADELRDKK